MTRKKTKAVYALAMLGLLGCGLIVLILAADEQSIISSGLPAADKISLQELITQGSSRNKHIELADFYFGKTFIYATELVQFNEVYVPMFPSGQPEDGRNLHLLLLIRNDRNSNEPLIQTRGELGRFVAEFDRDPRSVTGVLRKPSDRVRSLTAEAGNEWPIASGPVGKRFSNPGFREYPLEYLRALSSGGSSLRRRIQATTWKL